MGTENTTLNLVIIYSFLSVSLASSVSNIVIILLQKALNHTIALIIFLMQICSLGMTLINFTYHSSINQHLCKIQSSFFYSFMTTNFLLLSYLFLTIYNGLKEQGKLIKKYNGIIICCLFIIPLVYSFISYDSYTPCGYSSFDFYCGICSKKIPLINRILVSLNYTIPSALGIVIFIVLGVHLFKLDKSKLSNQQKLALKIIPIPMFNMVYLVLDSIITILLKTSFAGDGQFYLYITIDSMYCLVPFINLFFYSNFVYHWSLIIDKKQLKCCKWMVCFAKDNQNDQRLKVVIDPEDQQ